MVERSLQELDFDALTAREFFPSPPAWEDQVLYFLMLDRFSDGREKEYRDNDGGWVTHGSTSPFQPSDAENAMETSESRKHWREAGAGWVGGTLRGLKSKIGYLKRLGVTAVWISPVFKQVAFQETYHGYGIQNFLDVDPHFGTRRDLKDLVRTAHSHGIRVILDIILNHAGNIFQYSPDRHWTKDPDSGRWYIDPRWDGGRYAVKGFNDRRGNPDVPFMEVGLPGAEAFWPDDAVWPLELQNPEFYTRKGRINSWDWDPEFYEGDFFDLKDIHLGTGPIDHYVPSPALKGLCQVYRFWIAYADLDGFRVDTVKHMDPGAVRFFTSAIHEFTQSIGKENFYLIGEITGGRQHAFRVQEETGLNAALGIADIPDKLEYLVKGYRNPSEYFDLFRNSLLVQKESHVWFRNRVVTVLDDHDQVRKGNQKARFCAGDPAWRRLLPAVLGLNTTTLGIPCIYYGAEQGFDGAGGNDRYIREAMFGGEFGPFRSRGRHCFDESGPGYRALAEVLRIRRKTIALRRGRQYLREISPDGLHFQIPTRTGEDRMRSVVAWSRIFNDREMVIALNTDADEPRSAWIIVDGGLHSEGDFLKCIYSTDRNQLGQTAVVRKTVTGAAAFFFLVPPAGFVILKD
jgi:glycosidase